MRDEMGNKVGEYSEGGLNEMRQIEIENCKWAEFNQIDLNQVDLGLRMSDNTLLMYHLALHRASRFQIIPLNYIKSTTFLNNTIPSVCTTNSIVASMMVLSYYNNSNYFIHQSVMKIGLGRRNQECNTCGVPNYLCRFSSRTRLAHLFDYFGIDEIIIGDEIYSRGDKRTIKIELMRFNKMFGMYEKDEYRKRIYLEVTRNKKQGRIAVMNRGGVYIKPQINRK
ncbi:hypothetical protein ECANGB1_1759 [Enterospora canceri]|uniref:Uncharacterized protein n=1 Tax=Enterospora canceri TaxID=1081671 RepID=A0A1Y1S5I5_9MICR|nr:hypothetical protein ECANGB1_1759 [Enterospora canceri]